MKSENEVAFKEWASVVEALARGMYVLTLRKGGIHEKRGEFSVEHREYFLFPTLLHQRESDLLPAVLPLLAASKRDAPAKDAGAQTGGHAAAPSIEFENIPIRYYVSVAHAVYIEDLKRALALEGLHPFSAAAVEMRFQYKQPGLWAIVQRLYALPEARLMADNRLYAGCRSWVPLNEKISTAGVKPVLGDEEFSKHLEPIVAVIGAPEPTSIKLR